MKLNVPEPVTFTIPERLPCLNDMLSQSNRNRHVYAKAKKAWTALCGQWILAAGVPKFNGPVAVSFKWFERNRRRDLDNVAAGKKYVLDALVDTGRLSNDGRAWVRVVSDHFPEPDPKRPRVEVTITPV